MQVTAGEWQKRQRRSRVSAWPQTTDGPILVTGGTGTLGRQVVGRIREAVGRVTWEEFLAERVGKAA